VHVYFSFLTVGVAIIFRNYAHDIPVARKGFWGWPFHNL